jgi:hypothetical protein
LRTENKNLAIYVTLLVNVSFFFEQKHISCCRVFRKFQNGKSEIYGVQQSTLGGVNKKKRRKEGRKEKPSRVGVHWSVFMRCRRGVFRGQFWLTH